MKGPRRNHTGIQESRRQVVAIHQERTSGIHDIRQTKVSAKKYDEMVAEMNKGLRPGGRNRLSR